MDRIQLNQQIGDTIVSFLNRNGCFQVACAVSVDDLSNKLSCINNQCDQQVVITTIQKMRALMENKVLLAKLKFKIQSLNSNSFCRLGIVTDEAHRSHGSSTRSELTRLFQGLGCKESNILVKQNLAFFNINLWHSMLDFRQHQDKKRCNCLLRQSMDLEFISILCKVLSMMAMF